MKDENDSGTGKKAIAPRSPRAWRAGGFRTAIRRFLVRYYYGLSWLFPRGARWLFYRSAQPNRVLLVLDFDEHPFSIGDRLVSLAFAQSLLRAEALSKVDIAVLAAIDGRLCVGATAETALLRKKPGGGTFVQGRAPPE